MHTKKQIAIALSKIKNFEAPKIKLEQYMTDSEIASDVLWHAALHGHVEGKVVADLGCGTGIFGIGALLLGARHVHFVEVDEDALHTLKENLKAHAFPHSTYSLHHTDVSHFGQRVDTIFMNPPFGTRDEHADRRFLLKAFSLARQVYSISLPHQASSKRSLLTWMSR